MNELIQVAERQIGDGAIQTVNARDLHAFLGSKRQFADWISERIQKYGFVENQDFAIASQNCDAKSPGQRGGHNKKEFFLTLDMAKELAMVEKQYNDVRGESYTYTRTLVTGKGLAYIQKRLHGLKAEVSREFV